MQFSQPRTQFPTQIKLKVLTQNKVDAVGCNINAEVHYEGLQWHFRTIHFYISDQRGFSREFQWLTAAPAEPTHLLSVWTVSCAAAQITRCERQQLSVKANTRGWDGVSVGGWWGLSSYLSNLIKFYFYHYKCSQWSSGSAFTETVTCLNISISHINMKSLWLLSSDTPCWMWLPTLC